MKTNSTQVHGLSLIQENEGLSLLQVMKASTSEFARSNILFDLVQVLFNLCSVWGCIYYIIIFAGGISCSIQELPHDPSAVVHLHSLPGGQAISQTEVQGQSEL